MIVVWAMQRCSRHGPCSINRQMPQPLHATCALPVCPQAVLALREMVLGRWAALGASTQQGTLQLLLHLALAQLAGDPRPLLRTQVTATAAAVIKRGWPESSPAERDAALQAIHGQATAIGSLEARRAGLELLAAVVVEFSPTTASQMGLSW